MQMYTLWITPGKLHLWIDHQVNSLNQVENFLQPKKMGSLYEIGQHRPVVLVNY